MRDKHFQRENYQNYLYSGFIGFLFRWQHRLLSPKIYENCERVLEIGPGYEPNIKFTKLNYKEYYCLELNENIDHNQIYDLLQLVQILMQRSTQEEHHRLIMTQKYFLALLTLIEVTGVPKDS